MVSLWDLHFFKKGTYWEISIIIINRLENFYIHKTRPLAGKENTAQARKGNTGQVSAAV